MKISGSYTLHSPREIVWVLCQDSASLVRLIPGSEQPEQTNPTEYRGQMQIPVVAVVLPGAPGLPDAGVRYPCDAAPRRRPPALHNPATLDDLAHQPGKLTGVILHTERAAGVM